MTPSDVLDLIAAASDTDGETAGLVARLPLPPRRPEPRPIPEDLPALLRKRLARAGVEELWSHQVAALDHARAGRSVVVSTGTASGKSLAYQLPALERLLTDPDATVLYLAPTKALARDQLRGLRSLTLPQVRAAVLDGDTPRPEREAIRRTANWILTNPDLLHHSMLPGNKHWAEFLHRLAFVIVDEAHVARGVFGSHIANVLRRLRRLCERYSAEPQFLLASATIGNPAEHASALTGVDVVAVERDGSPRGPFTLGCWQPELADPEAGDGRRRSLLGETGDLLARFAAADVQTIAFTASRKASEVVAVLARERLGDEHAAHDRIAAYRGGFLAEERRDLEDRLRSGELLGVVATNALELGIDVTGVDAVLLMGWPGTFASFRQRIGRAGRQGGDAVGVFVAGEDPLDQFLLAHADELMTRDPEDAILDHANPYLLGPHLRCACEDAPMTTDEAVRWFGDTAAEHLAADVEAGRLRLRGKGEHALHFWTQRRRAAGEVNLRSAGGEPIDIVDTTTGSIVGDVEAARAPRQVHPGAVYLHQGQQYEIDDLDLAGGLALARPAPRIPHVTRPRSDTDVRVRSWLAEHTWGDDGELGIGLARVQVTSQVTGYDVLRPGTDEVLSREELDMPPSTLDTVAVWWSISERLLREARIAPADWPGALHAAEHAAIGLLPLIALCDRWDIGGLSTALHPDTGTPTVFIHDGYPGGAGLAERSFLRLPEHLRATRETVDRCPCDTGCPSCVQSPKCGNGNEPLHKRGAVQVLDILLARAPADWAPPRPSRHGRPAESS